MCRVWRSATAWLVCYRGFASCCKCGCKSGLALRSRRVIRATLCTLHSALCTFEGSLRLSLWPCDRRRVACVRVTSTVFPCPVSAQSSSRPQWIKGTVFSRFDLCLESLLSRLYGSPRVRFKISPRPSLPDAFSILASSFWDTKMALIWYKLAKSYHVFPSLISVT